MIAGAAGGFLVASVFVIACELTLFSLVKDPPVGFQSFFEKFRPASLALWVAILGYPTWGIIGAVMGLLYRISVEEAPGAGIGSPNVVFTVAVVVVASAMVAPFIVLARRVARGVLAITLTFIGVFGWFVPHFAA